MAANGFGYVGALLYEAGYALGRKHLPALVWPRAIRRSSGVCWPRPDVASAPRASSTLWKKAGVEVIYQEIDDATNKDAAAGVPVFVGVMSANPDIKMIVTDHGNLTGTQQTFLESAGLGPDDVFAAGFDLSIATVEAIRGGWTDLVIDQQQWLQGYFGSPADLPDP